MQVTSYQDRGTRPPRFPARAALLLWFASLAGLAQAVDFEEQLKAPMARSGTEVKTMAESYSASFARFRDLSPREMVTSKTLNLDLFNLKWQIDRALEDKRPLEDLSALGLMKKEGGGIKIDLNAFPQWNPFPEVLASMMPIQDMDTLSTLLVARGFRDSDVEAMRQYIQTHDVKAASAARTLPIAISFSKVVKKYDRIKRPVGKDLVFSYIYQRDKARSEARRAWSEGLIQQLDDQRVRILHSYFAEMKGTSSWFPSDAEAGIAGVLAVMRLPDYEQRATEEARGATP